MCGEPTVQTGGQQGECYDHEPNDHWPVGLLTHVSLLLLQMEVLGTAAAIPLLVISHFPVGTVADCGRSSAHRGRRRVQFQRRAFGKTWRGADVLGRSLVTN